MIHLKTKDETKQNKEGMNKIIVHLPLSSHRHWRNLMSQTLKFCRCRPIDIGGNSTTGFITTLAKFVFE